MDIGEMPVKVSEKVPEKDPAPVDVKASVPLEIKVAPESIEALGGDVAKSKAPDSSVDEELPLPVIITAEQPPVPVVITAPDGVTPIPIPSLGIEANTSPGASAPVPGYIQDEVTVTPVAAGGTPGQVTTTTITTVPVPTTVTKGEGTTLLPTTTEAEDTTTEGQRRVNLVWELTQAGISVLITTAVIYCSVYEIPSDNLANAFFLIIGFYFSRTNHQAIGGIGSKPVNPYIGRII